MGLGCNVACEWGLGGYSPAGQNHWVALGGSVDIMGATATVGCVCGVNLLRNKVFGLNGGEEIFSPLNRGKHNVRNAILAVQLIVKYCWQLNRHGLLYHK